MFISPKRKIPVLEMALTEPRWPLQPRGTQWFLRIGLFAVQAISLGTCRRPIEFLTSSHPCRHFSKIPNFQIHKVVKWQILSPFQRIWKKKLDTFSDWPRINQFFSKNPNCDPKHEIPKNQLVKLNRYHYWIIIWIMIWHCWTGPKWLTSKNVNL